MSSTQNIVFVLGAGFSFEQGYPLTRDLREKVISFLKSEDNDRRRFLDSWNGGYQKGQFFEGLHMVEGDNELAFEELLLKLKERIKSGDKGPFYITNDEMRIGARRVLWEIENARCLLKPAYKNFGDWLRLNRKRSGIISFNWDLLAERIVKEAGVPWCYWLGEEEALPVIKPHGSINWNRYLRNGLIAHYPCWTRIRGTGLSFDDKNPFSDCQLDDVVPQLSHLLYPGDSDAPKSDDDLEAIWRDASRLLERAREVVFIGYSFPNYDQYSLCFFRDRMKNKRVTVINPSLADLQKFKRVLGTVGAEVDFRQKSFGKCEYAQPDT